MHRALLILKNNILKIKNVKMVVWIFETHHKLIIDFLYLLNVGLIGRES